MSLTIDQMQTLLASVQGCTFASLDTLTIPVLKGGKANPMQGKINKQCIGHRVMLFTNTNSSGYENKVKRHLEASGINPANFTVGALPWGKRLDNSPIIENNGKHYLQVVFLKAGTVEYHATQEILFNEFMGIGCTHYCAGEYIPKANIPGLNERTGSEGQGLPQDQQVIVRAYALDSILAIRAMNEQLISN